MLFKDYTPRGWDAPVADVIASLREEIKTQRLAMDLMVARLANFTDAVECVEVVERGGDERKRILRLWTALQEARNAFHQIIDRANESIDVKVVAIAQRALDALPDKP